jgi:hypothetical protein
MQLPAQEQSAALFTVDEVDDKVSVNSGWLTPMHYNKSQQVSQLSTCLRYSFNYKRHEHTFCHHFDIETFRGVRAPQPGIEWTSNGKHWFHTGYVDMPCLICSYSNPKLRPEWFNQQKNVWEVSSDKATNTRINVRDASICAATH